MWLKQESYELKFSVVCRVRLSETGRWNMGEITLGSVCIYLKAFAVLVFLQRNSEMCCRYGFMWVSKLPSCKESKTNTIYSFYLFSGVVGFDIPWLSLQILQAVIPLITFFQGWKLYDLSISGEGESIMTELKITFQSGQAQGLILCRWPHLFLCTLTLSFIFFLIFGKLRAINQNGK